MVRKGLDNLHCTVSTSPPHSCLREQVSKTSHNCTQVSQPENMQSMCQANLKVHYYPATHLWPHGLLEAVVKRLSHKHNLLLRDIQFLATFKAHEMYQYQVTHPQPCGLTVTHTCLITSMYPACPEVYQYPVTHPQPHGILETVTLT